MKKILSLCVIIANFTFAQTLLLYGGSNNDQFLGCMNCDKYDKNSIWNEYGTYGSKYSSTSIWNKYGSYGGQYSQYSPFNPYTSKAPVIVDSRGEFYGHLSANKYHNKRATSKLALVITEYWEKIGENSSEAYDLIFK